MSRNAWIVFIVVCLGTLAGLAFLSNKSKVKVDVTNTNANVVLPAQKASGNIGDHVKGNANSKVVLVEYADFQCPGCATAYPRIKAITEEYKDQIAFVYRVMPLTTIHPHALAAAATAEAAGLQGKYWEMADLLFNNQDAWANLTATERTNTFLNYARQLNLDETKFNSDLTSPEVSLKIAYDQALADKNNITGTPSFFLNGEAWSQEIWGDDDAIRNALNAKLKEYNITPPSSSATTN